MSVGLRRIDPLNYDPYGGAQELMRTLESEVLYEGPAGTGKTLGVLQKVHLLCTVYQKIRVLFIRKTLKSLRESVLVTWEEEVLGEGHPAITGTATRSHRDSYTFPETKAHIVLAGIDTPSRHMSTQFDVICCFEACELLENDLEYLLTRNRNWMMQFQQVICDTNPRQPTHWLNKRANRLKRIPDDPRLPKPPLGAKQMVRIKSRHEDNPFLYDHEAKEWTPQGVDYLGKLEGLHGPRFAWFRQGEWKAAEGLVLPQFDAEKNVVDWGEVPELRWFVAGVDFGFHAPGVLQIWGFTGDREQPIGEQRGYRVAEVYRKGWTIEEWAQACMELRQEWPYRVGVADAADPGSIKFLNDYLGRARGRSGQGVFQPCDKSKGIASGLELLRSVLADEPAREENGSFYPGGPRCYFVRDAFPYGIQEELRSLGKECSFETEVESFTFPENDGTKKDGDLPDKRCADHAIDTARYVWTWGWGKNLRKAESRHSFPPDTYGALFGTPETLWAETVRSWRRDRSYGRQ
jgi:phage terminase large subunit